jgi:hypothetical protein
VFPSGFPVGVIKSVKPGQPFQEILVEPAGLKRGLEDVLILTEDVHQEIPDTPVNNQPIYIAPPPPNSNAPATELPRGTTGTEADRLRALYKSVGEAQNHTYGEGEPGSKPPDFSKLPVGKNTGAGGLGLGVGAPAHPEQPPVVKPQPPAGGAAPGVTQPPTPNPQSPAPPPTVRRANQAAGAPGGPPKE